SAVLSECCPSYTTRPFPWPEGPASTAPNNRHCWRLSGYWHRVWMRALSWLTPNQNLPEVTYARRNWGCNAFGFAPPAFVVHFGQCGTYRPFWTAQTCFGRRELIVYFLIARSASAVSKTRSIARSSDGVVVASAASLMTYSLPSCVTDPCFTR